MIEAPSYEQTVELLKVAGEGSRVRLTAANGYSVTGVYTTHDYGHTIDHLLNGNGGASILHMAMRVEVMRGTRYEVVK